MACTFRIDVARGLVLSRSHGTLSDEDVITHQRELARHPDFDPSLDQIFDLCAAEHIEVRSETVRDLAAKNPFGPGSRRAFVVSSDLAFGMVRMFQLMAEGTGDETAVFRSVEQARQWLDAPDRSAPGAGGR